MKMVFRIHNLLSTIIFMLIICLSNSSDPDPLQDFCIADLTSTASLNGYPCKPSSNVTSDDFFFNGLTKPGNTSNSLKSWVTQGNVVAFPGLNTLGMSMNRVDIAPGGITHPHIHPRATECGVLIQGSLQVGLITSGNVVYAKNLSVGQVFVIPRGLVHFQMNIGNVSVLVFTAFNSHMPGTVQVSRNLFASKPSVPDEVLRTAFQVNQSIVDELKTKISSM